MLGGFNSAGEAGIEIRGFSLAKAGPYHHDHKSLPQQTSVSYPLLLLLQSPTISSCGWAFAHDCLVRRILSGQRRLRAFEPRLHLRNSHQFNRSLIAGSFYAVLVVVVKDFLHFSFPFLLF
jgi:hypothetical protein